MDLVNNGKKNIKKSSLNKKINFLGVYKWKFFILSINFNVFSNKLIFLFFLVTDSIIMV
jgi:hypothetical protein